MYGDEIKEGFLFLFFIFFSYKPELTDFCDVGLLL